MARLKLARIVGGKETILEVTELPNASVPSMIFYPPNHIEELEKHYKRTGKPKKRSLDVLYVTRLQVERWTDEELKISSAPAAKEEIERRAMIKGNDEQDTNNCDCN